MGPSLSVCFCHQKLNTEPTVALLATPQDQLRRAYKKFCVFPETNGRAVLDFVHSTISPRKVDSRLLSITIYGKKLQYSLTPVFQFVPRLLEDSRSNYAFFKKYMPPECTWNNYFC